MSDDRRLVVSLCGTFLKPEMQSLYRQMIGQDQVQRQMTGNSAKAMVEKAAFKIGGVIMQFNTLIQLVDQADGPVRPGL